MLNKNKKQKQQLRRKSKKLNTLFNKNSKGLDNVDHTTKMM